jgi:hypothetical protein
MPLDGPSLALSQGEDSIFNYYHYKIWGQKLCRPKQNSSGHAEDAHLFCEWSCALSCLFVPQSETLSFTVDVLRFYKLQCTFFQG